MDKQQNIFFEQLYRLYYIKLLRVANSFIKNEAIAEELADETFVVLLTQIDIVQNHPNPIGWLYTVLQRHAINELRRVKRRSEVSFDEIPDIGTEQEMIAFADTLPRGLRDHEREILDMRFSKQMRYDEIAEHTGASPEASRTQLHRAKRHCSELIESEQKKHGI